MQHIIENGTWKNQEAHPGAELGAPKVNATIAAGSSQTIGPFTATGTFHFYCTIHPGMNLNGNCNVSESQMCAQVEHESYSILGLQSQQKGVVTV